MRRDTGFRGADAQDDFQRARRRQVMSLLARRLSRDSRDVDVILPFDEDYVPISDMVRDAGMVEAAETETDAYMRIVGQRYQLMRTHEWSEEILARLRDETA